MVKELQCNLQNVKLSKESLMLVLPVPGATYTCVC